MSILAQTTQPHATLNDYALLLAMLVISIAVGRAAAVFKRHSVQGPPRLDPRASTWPLFVTMIIATALRLGMQIAFGVIKQMHNAANGQPRSFQIEQLSSGELAFLATVPGVMGVAAIVIGDLLLGRRLLRQLGLDPRNILPGFLKAIVGMLIALPLVCFTAAVFETIYRIIDYKHPMEHDLLRAIGQIEDPITVAILIGGAVFVAPVFEELLFRGHLQTLLARGIHRIAALVTGPELGRGFEVLPAPPLLAPAQSELQLSDGPIFAPQSIQPPWQLWLAIVITSVIFAVIHPAWSIPPILVLSICLGYAYERTGNLWVPIFMHLLFNGFMTVLYLFYQGV